MAGIVALTELRERILNRADHDDSQFISVTELDALINESYAEFIDMLLEVTGPETLATQSVVTTTVGLPSLQLNYYRLLSLQLLVNGQYEPLEQGSFMDTQRADGGWGWGQSRAVIYHPGPMNATATRQIGLWPAPQAVHSVRVYYIPTVTELVLGTDTLNGLNGWEQWIVLDCAIKILEKEESDTTALMRRLEKLEARIQAAAMRANQGRSQAIANVENLYRPSDIRALPWWDV